MRRHSVDAGAVCFISNLSFLLSRVATPSLVTFDSGLERHPVL
jgi:hypothetical protein